MFLSELSKNVCKYSRKDDIVIDLHFSTYSGIRDKSLSSVHLMGTLW